MEEVLKKVSNDDYESFFQMPGSNNNNTNAPTAAANTITNTIHNSIKDRKVSAA